jgi:hypothetical protein
VQDEDAGVGRSSSGRARGPLGWRGAQGLGTTSHDANRARASTPTNPNRPAMPMCHTRRRGAREAEPIMAPIIAIPGAVHRA